MSTSDPLDIISSVFRFDQGDFRLISTKPLFKSPLRNRIPGEF
jgi:hypothetical protein